MCIIVTACVKTQIALPKHHVLLNRMATFSLFGSTISKLTPLLTNNLPWIFNRMDFPGARNLNRSQEIELNSAGLAES
jgi:hypothetical protein